jgi:hypothetical protein
MGASKRRGMGKNFLIYQYLTGRAMYRTLPPEQRTLRRPAGIGKAR